MTPAERIQVFREAARDPLGYAARLKQSRNRPIVGHSCTYFPEEIVWAAGAHPLRIFGTSTGILKADAHMQAYACSLARSILEDALSGRLDVLDVMAFPHTCDTMQRLSDIWRLNIGSMVHLDLLFPARLDSDAARDYLVAVLERFRTTLGQSLDVEISADALSEAVSVMNRVRTALAALYDLRSRSPELLSGSALSDVIRGAMVMDRVEAATHLEKLHVELQAQETTTDRTPRKRILLSGGVCLHPGIHDIVEAQGGAVVSDDLCTGTRWFEPLVREDLPPIQAMADRYIQRPICPAKHIDIHRRMDDLVKQVSRHRIDGVIFLFLKFCDPHGFDYPDLAATLDASGIPSLLLEVETGKPVDGPTRTRIETFLQILNQKAPAS